VMMGLKNKTILMVGGSYRIGKTCGRFLLITNADVASTHNRNKKLANKLYDNDGSVL